MELNSTLYSTCFFASIVLSLALRLVVKEKKTLHPPGPSGDPIIGHARLIPGESPWLEFAEWGKKWGGLIYVRVLGKPFIIINELRIARDLLDKRGSVYSERPRFTLAAEMIGWDRTLVFLSYGDKFRRQRRMIQQHLNPQAVRNFKSIQRAELYIMLNNFVESPERFSAHVRRAIAGTLTNVTYGYRVTTDDDPFVILVEKATDLSVKAGSLGGILVDFIPTLRHIPTWFPGAGFKRHALECKEYVEQLLNTPFQSVMHSRARGIAPPSFTSSLLDEGEGRGRDYEEEVRDVSGTIFGPGFETTKATVHTFIFAMLQYPDVAKRAQADIEQVTGRIRMPDLDDRDDLPLIDAILKECFRWCPPVPLGIPHSLLKSDEYCGMRIPGKSIVVPNIWQFMHDERVFHEPETFDPTRYLRNSGQDTDEVDYNPLNVVFGFGRRTCPGRYFAEQGLWLIMASILAAFDILPPLDENGNAYIPDVVFTSGTTSEPVKFDCRLISRGEEYIRLIQQGQAM